MTALFQLTGLQKTFGTQVLFSIDTLSIANDQAYVLTGRNGSGKSTLLRILCGLEKANIISARWDGQDVRLTPFTPELRPLIGFVHQQPMMFSSSVFENVAYGLRRRSIPEPIMREHVEQALDWSGLRHLSERHAPTLSGGEQQRIALARAKVLQPKLLLLDEPTANLDGEAREQVIALIPDLIGQGASVIMACHDKDLIALPSVQRWKLRDGQLEIR